MRAIKFRVWDKSKNKLSLVKSINYADDGYAETVIIEPAPKTEYYNGLVNGENGVLQQFTGLLDTNGKEIYEGDILRLRITIETKGYHTSEVWRDISGAWCVNPNPKHTNGSSRALINFIKDGNSCYESRFAECEIIGNIFENPELIENK